MTRLGYFLYMWPFVVWIVLSLTLGIVGMIVWPLTYLVLIKPTVATTQ